MPVAVTTGATSPGNSQHSRTRSFTRSQPKPNQSTTYQTSGNASRTQQPITMEPVSVVLHDPVPQAA